MSDAAASRIVSSAQNYSEKIMETVIVNEDGSRAEIRLPVKAVKKLISLSGKLPNKNAGVNGVEVEKFIGVISDRLDSETQGRIAELEKQGMVMRVFVK